MEVETDGIRDRKNDKQGIYKRREKKIEIKIKRSKKGKIENKERYLIIQDTSTVVMSLRQNTRQTQMKIDQTKKEKKRQTKEDKSK